MFYLPFERVAGEICQIVNIVPSLIKELHLNWQAVDRQHACSRHKNVILNETIKPRSCHLRFNT